MESLMRESRDSVKEVRDGQTLSVYIFQLELTRFPERLDVGCERTKVVKDVVSLSSAAAVGIEVRSMKQDCEWWARWFTVDTLGLSSIGHPRENIAGCVNVKSRR